MIDIDNTRHRYRVVDMDTGQYYAFKKSNKGLDSSPLLRKTELKGPHFIWLSVFLGPSLLSPITNEAFSKPFFLSYNIFTYLPSLL